MFKKEKASDFYEMLLHHIATCSLYFCMIFGNAMSLGCMVAYLHDIADIIVHLCRVSSTTEFEKAAVGLFGVLIATWFWTRILLLPQIIYKVFTQEWAECVRTFSYTNGIFLLVLQFMHIYWFYLFYVMAMAKIKTGKAEDIQNRPVDDRKHK